MASGHWALPIITFFLSHFLGWRFIGVFMAIGLVLGFLAVCQLAESAPSRSVKAGTPDLNAKRFDRFPLRFVENAGQFDGAVQFFARKPGLTAFFTNNAFVLSLAKVGSEGCSTEGSPESLFFTFEGALRTATVVGVTELPTREHHFRGPDSNAWRPDAASFTSIRYRGLYAGIDLVVYDKNGRLEYDLIANPGADLSQVVIRCDGAKRLTLSHDGDLSIETSVGVLNENAPLAEQLDEHGQPRERVDCSFRHIDDSRFGFTVPHSESSSLRIDPGLEYCTYLGGASADAVTDIAVDEAGTLYITGSTYSTDFPTTPGSFDTTVPPSATYYESFIAKLDSSGSQLLFATALDFCGLGAIGIDTSHSMYFAGTGTKGFPVTPHSFNPMGYVLQNYTPVIGKLNSTGNALVYSSYIGGIGASYGIAINGQGQAYVCGGAGDNQNSPFPVTSGTYGTNNGSVFITKVSTTGSALIYSSLFGASTQGIGGNGNAIAIDDQGGAYIAGWVDGPTFPITLGAPQPTFAGGTSDGFVSKLSADATTLVYSTYLGSPFQYSSSDEQALAITVDAQGCVYVAGATSGPGFPITPGAFKTVFQGGLSAYITKLNPTGTGLVYSTYLGGSVGGGSAWGITLDGLGNAYVTGFTSDIDFPITPGAFQPSYAAPANTNGYLAVLDSLGGGLLYGSYLGGALDTGGGTDVIARGADGAIYLGGLTNSPYLPITPGAFDAVLNNNGASSGFTDGFLAKVTIGTPDGITSYGNGTPGCAGPQSLAVYSIPKVGNSLFEIACSHCPPDSLGLLLITNQSYATDSDPFGI
ncbi:MAG: SBBP repeat-containing protein, partial [Planctomycetes bacterium]|nr:SBBP repeat-containing protein [Planctomycetota bacterium]